MSESPKYLDESLSFAERAKDLVSRMTLEEKASQMVYTAPAIPRLGIPAYNWWNEALHGVARAGTATMFPQAIAMAAMFDADMVEHIGSIIAEEGRAKYNEYSRQNDRDIYKGLTFWSPNINIFRDPRWGRGHETYGEDPFLTATLGVRFVKGLQGDDPKYLKASACAKHFAVHSGPESLRHEFDAVVSKQDLYDTYLPAFEALVKEAKVESVMGAYNRVYGQPACANDLLTKILRGDWGFEGHFVSDCGAISDFHLHHKVTDTAPESAALAVKHGCDLNCGSVYLHILTAIREGLLTEEDVTPCVERLMATRMKLGMFDEHCPYDDIPFSANDSPEHREVSLEAARRAQVLLKNDGILPLDADKLSAVAVIGPNADSRAVLQGNYNGTASRYVTILEGIEDLCAGKARVYYSEGCPLWRDKCEGLALPGDRLAEAVSVARQADVVVLCLGLDPSIEGEEGDASNEYGAGDKNHLRLPGLQQKLLEKVVAVGKPTILVLASGSALAVNFAQEHCNAVVQSWYPGALGGRAVAELLFGQYSPSGRLPVTFYKSEDDLPAFTDYAMEGRTYRYLHAIPLYPFGYGLSYAKFTCENLQLSAGSIASGDSIDATVTVRNDSDILAATPVLFFLRDEEASTRVPHFSLCAFERIELEPGQSRQVSVRIAPRAMELVTEEGERVIEPGEFTLFAGLTAPDDRSAELTGVRPLSARFEVK